MSNLVIYQFFNTGQKGPQTLVWTILGAKAWCSLQLLLWEAWGRSWRSAW